MISEKEWLGFCHENAVMRGVKSVHEEKRTCYYCHSEFLLDPYTDCTPQYCSPECKRKDEEEYRKVMPIPDSTPRLTWMVIPRNLDAPYASRG
jgi:hypothetical protein